MISSLNSKTNRGPSLGLSLALEYWSCFSVQSLENKKWERYQTISNVKDIQRVLADVNFNVLKNLMLHFIEIFRYIFIYSNYKYSYLDKNFLNKYIRICIRSWKKYSLTSGAKVQSARVQRCKGAKFTAKKIRWQTDRQAEWHRHFLSCLSQLKMRLGFCLISRQSNIGYSNRFFLLKTEIHTQILITEPFFCNFGGLRHLRNKIGIWK